MVPIGDLEGNIGSNNMKEYRAFNPTHSKQSSFECSRGSKSVSPTASSMKSSLSKLSTIYNNYSRHLVRRTSSRSEDENALDIPLVEMAGDPGDHDLRRIRKYGPELV